ncbi:MAG: glycosyltransferase family 4 protein [Thermoplasmatales archaeon]|nr:glycosyltransferase family 4 protein [Thermoplasmatales archaeon]
MTHICLVGYDICPPWNEGRKVVSRNIIDALKKYTDLDVSVVSTIEKKEEKKMEGVEYANTTWFTKRTQGYDPLLDAALIRRISTINKRKKIDIIHLFNAHFPVFSLYGKIKRKKVIAQFFGNPHFNILKQFRVPKSVDIYITTSIGNTWFSDLGINKFQCVNPPIDTNLFNPKDKVTARKKLNLPENEFVLLYIGNLSEVRFSPDFIESVKFLKFRNNLLLIFANQVDTYWQNNNAFHNKNVILRKGILDEKQKALLYNAADAFILPFSKKMNSFKHVFIIDPPITMLEAMSCGVPVIAPDVFSIPKIIKNGYNGYITPLGDFEMIDEILYDLSKGDNEEIGINARETIINDFSFKKTALRMKRIYEGVLNG